MPFAFGAAGGGQQAQAQPAESEPIGEPVPLGRPMPKSVEEDVGHRLASLKNARIREATIDGAMTAYGITRSLAEQIHDIAISNDIEPELAFGLVKTESAFDNRAVSNVGARGLTQVMPRTARWLRPGTTIEDLYNRQLNLDMGFGYLRDLIDKYKGDVRLALLAYNRGPGTVDRVLDAGGNPDNGYADKVLEGYDDLG
jgi:soluble lytic murein transglycosylase-like protein